MSEIEELLGFINRAYVYQIPPAKTTKGHRASDWDLENPLNKNSPFSVRVVEVNDKCIIRIIDPKTNELFVDCVYTSASVEKTLDSSRYFVLYPTDEKGRRAYLGLGFQERSEAFEFEQALSTHDKYQNNQKNIELMKQEWSSQDLSLKAGEKIKVKLPITSSIKKKETSDDDDNQTNPFILPPPPGGLNINNTSTSNVDDQQSEWTDFNNESESNDDWATF